MFNNTKYKEIIFNYSDLHFITISLKSLSVLMTLLNLLTAKQISCIDLSLNIT
jgi:hypothetical protein